MTKTSYLINQSNEHGKYYRFIEEYITIKHCFRDIDTSRYTKNKFHQVSAHNVGFSAVGNNAWLVNKPKNDYKTISKF